MQGAWRLRRRTGEVDARPASGDDKVRLIRSGGRPRNMTDNPTLEQLRELLRKGDDLAGHHVLWVKKDRTVVLTQLPRGPRSQIPPYEPPDVQMRYGTFPVPYECVGTRRPTTGGCRCCSQAWSRIGRKPKAHRASCTSRFTPSLMTHPAAGKSQPGRRKPAGIASANRKRRNAERKLRKAVEYSLTVGPALTSR
jgi:hypothetical protein